MSNVIPIRPIKVTWKLKLHIILSVLFNRFTKNKSGDTWFLPVPPEGYPSVNIKLNDDNYDY